MICILFFVCIIMLKILYFLAVCCCCSSRIGRHCAKKPRMVGSQPVDMIHALEGPVPFSVSPLGSHQDRRSDRQAPRPRQVSCFFARSRVSSIAVTDAMRSSSLANANAKCFVLIFLIVDQCWYKKKVCENGVYPSSFWMFWYGKRWFSPLVKSDKAVSETTPRFSTRPPNFIGSVDCSESTFVLALSSNGFHP